jgi:ankyrin repeat protein
MKQSHLFILLVFLLAATFSAAIVRTCTGAEPLPSPTPREAGNWETVKSLVKAGLKSDGINISDKDGTRPLHWAVRADELEIADLLLKAGADATAQNRLGLTALNLAAANGNGAMMRKLLDHGADANEVEKTGETILMVATRSAAPTR